MEEHGHLGCEMEAIFLGNNNRLVIVATKDAMKLHCSRQRSQVSMENLTLRWNDEFATGT
jgi:hypothetical protein